MIRDYTLLAVVLDEKLMVLLVGLETVCPVLYESVLASVRCLTSHGPHPREECDQCLSYLHTLDAILSNLPSLRDTDNLHHHHHQEKVPISQEEVEKALVARAARDENNIVLNDKIICCYICVVVIVIIVLVIVIIVMSVMEQKYRIF